MAPTGHSIIKQKISELKALLAGEMSGHIFFADHYYGYDDAIYAAIRLLNILHNSPYSLSELFDQIPKSVNTPEIRIPCKDSRKFQIIKEIQNQLRQQSIDFIDIDGIRLQTKKGGGCCEPLTPNLFLLLVVKPAINKILKRSKRCYRGLSKRFWFRSTNRIKIKRLFLFLKNDNPDPSSHGVYKYYENQSSKEAYYQIFFLSNRATFSISKALNSFHSVKITAASASLMAS